jgi:iron complex transport system permease protein
MKAMNWGILLVAVSLGMLMLGLSVGSTGWSPFWLAAHDASTWQIMSELRAPRCIGAWSAGALLGVGGALAQGLFRNPLADPYLLGSSAGAACAVALLLALMGVSPQASDWLVRLGVTGAAFVGAMAAVMLTLALARGVAHTLRLLLAGIIVGVVLGAFSALTMTLVPDIMRAMQAFMLGTTGFLSWQSVGLMVPVLLLVTLLGWGFGRPLDAMSLGDAAAHSLGVRLPVVRLWLIGALALATGAAVAQVGMIAFVGLVAPHLVRSRVHATHGPFMLLSALMGGGLLLAADILSRWLLAPQELPVGLLTAVLGGVYLLWRMHRMERAA